MSNEVSGRGYNNYLLFYDYSIEKYAQFVRFLIDRTYYNDPRVMVNFIKGDEDIFIGKSSLPTNYWSGDLIHLGYFVVLLIVGYFCFAAKMFPKPRVPKEFDKVDIKLKSGDNITLKDYTEDDTFRTQLVNAFLGKGRVKEWSLVLDGKPLEKGGIPGILYIPNPCDLPPEFKGKHLVRFFQRVFKIPKPAIAQLENEIGKDELNKFLEDMDRLKKYRVILSLFFLANRRYYVADNFPVGISPRNYAKLEQHVEKNKPAGTTIIDLNDMVLNRWIRDDSSAPLHYEKGKYYGKNPYE